MVHSKLGYSFTQDKEIGKQNEKEREKQGQKTGKAIKDLSPCCRTTIYLILQHYDLVPQHRNIRGGFFLL